MGKRKHRTKRQKKSAAAASTSSKGDEAKGDETKVGAGATAHPPETGKIDQAVAADALKKKLEHANRPSHDDLVNDGVAHATQSKVSKRIQGLSKKLEGKIKRDSLKQNLEARPHHSSVLSDGKLKYEPERVASSLQGKVAKLERKMKENIVAHKLDQAPHYDDLLDRGIVRDVDKVAPAIQVGRSRLAGRSAATSDEERSDGRVRLPACLLACLPACLSVCYCRERLSVSCEFFPSDGMGCHGMRRDTIR